MEQKLNGIIEKLRRDFNVPSIMASVHKDGETFFCGGGLADIENNCQATPDTVYAIASVSKTFIATALCILADENKLSLDDTVKKHIPDFEMHDPYRTANLTIRDALGHRSGLSRHDLTWLHQQDITMGDFVHKLRYLPATFPLRARMHYQNHMFALASVIVEQVSQKSWQGFIKEKILDPMGMTSTYANVGEYGGKGLKTASQPYEFKDGMHKRIARANVFDHMGCAAPMHSTVRDLDKWTRLQLGKGEYEGKRIYSQEMTKHLHSPQMIIKPKEMFVHDFAESQFVSYGQGWFVESYRGNKLVYHTGTIDGYKSIAGFLPDSGVGFSVLSNLSRNETPTALGYYICDLALGITEIDWGARFLKVMNDTKAEAEQLANDYKAKSKTAPTPTHPLSDYAGTYENDAYGQYDVCMDEAGLHMTIAGYRSFLIPIGYDNFVAEFPRYGRCIPVKFDYDAEGKICRLYAKFDQSADMIELVKIHKCNCQYIYRIL